MAFETISINSDLKLKLALDKNNMNIKYWSQYFESLLDLKKKQKDNN